MSCRHVGSLALIVAIFVTGCAEIRNGISSPTPGRTGGIAGKSIGPSDIFSEESNSSATSGNAKPAQSGATTANGPASAAKPNDSAAPGGHPVSGIGLSTFFDSYNFNFPVPAGQALDAVANTSQKSLPLAGGKMYLQIGLQTTAQPSDAKRLPLNVSFVFDKSGSMYGDKIDYSRIAAAQMVDQLGAQDLFSLVTFDSNVESLIAPAFGVDKEAMKARIEGIRPGSSTNIDGGLAQGYSHAKEGFKSDRINRVVLMSDGEANVGITDVETLGDRAATFAKEGVSLTTIGVGLGFNETFMTRLAERGNGSFYFVNSEEDARQAFVGEIKNLQRIVARDVKLAINLAEGVKVLQVYGHSAKTVGQSLNVDSNDLISQQSKVILLELSVPPGLEGTSARVASVAVDFEDVPFGGKKQAAAEATVTYTADTTAQAAGRNSQIASSVIILQTASVLLRAADLLDQGQKSQAKAELSQQYELVNAKSSELSDADLANEAKNLQQYLDRIDQTDPEVLKKELQFDAFQKQQGKKKVVAPVAG